MEVMWHKAESEKPTDDKRYLIYVFYDDDGSYIHLTDTYDHKAEKWDQEIVDWHAHVVFWAELPEPPIKVHHD